MPESMPARTIVLIASNIGQNFGGEAIKAWQYAHHLKAAGHPILIISHARCRAEVEAAFGAQEYRLIPDDRTTLVLWRTRPLRSFMSFYFHWQVRRLIRREGLDPKTHVLHYIAPISPVAVRLPPRGFPVVMGPLSGNIYYPPAFRARMGRGERLRERLHTVTQWLMGHLFGDKKRADVILNSGYARTRASLMVAGCRPEQFIDVADAGVNDAFVREPRLSQQGENRHFLCIGRLIDYKGYDLAIRAVARAHPETRLDIWGNGAMRGDLERLAAELGLAGRVAFRGWVANDALAGLYARYRAYVFPTLAEANGIVMQEAMMLGLPVVTLRWGGPAMLADDESAIFIAPESQDHVIDGLARAMDRLATDDALAEAISVRARAIAEAEFPWDRVAASWAEAYRRLPGGGA